MGPGRRDPKPRSFALLVDVAGHVYTCAVWHSPTAIRLVLTITMRSFQCTSGLFQPPDSARHCATAPRVDRETPRLKSSKRWPPSMAMGRGAKHQGRTGAGGELLEVDGWSRWARIYLRVGRGFWWGRRSDNSQKWGHLEVDDDPPEVERCRFCFHPFGLLMFVYHPLRCDAIVRVS